MLDPTFKCPYCGLAMARRKSAYGFFWSCTGWPDCDAKVGAHPDGKPLGVPARSTLRRWRRAAHLVFDPLWKKAADNPNPAMANRAAAYAWLKEATGIEHIAEQTVDGCWRVITAVYKREDQR